MADIGSHNKHETNCLSTSTRLEIDVVDGGNTANYLVGHTLGAVGQCLRHNELVVEFEKFLFWNFQYKMRVNTLNIYFIPVIGSRTACVPRPI
jgi:hypothetical protein